MGADGQVRHVVIVHHVEMDDIRAGGEHVLHFLAQPGEIRGQNGRGKSIVSHDDYP